MLTRIDQYGRGLLLKSTSVVLWFVSFALAVASLALLYGTGPGVFAGGPGGDCEPVLQFPLKESGEYLDVYLCGDGRLIGERVVYARQAPPQR